MWRQSYEGDKEGIIIEIQDRQVIVEMYFFFHSSFDYNLIIIVTTGPMG